MRFSQFITEAVKQMPRDEAMRVLGLSAGFSADDLKRAYRAASIKAHPDRGGSNEAMSRVNNANDALSGGGGSAKSGFAGQAQSYTYNRAEYEAQRAADQEKHHAYQEVARASFIENFDGPAFTRHFEKAFGIPFTHTIDKLETPKRAHDRGGMQYHGEWSNADRTIVLAINMWAGLGEMHDARMLSGADSFIRMTISTEILYNRKKVKLTQANWQMSDSKRPLRNPEVLFPSDKLRSQAAKSGKRKFMKRDFLLTLERELQASLSGDEWAYVPIGEFVVSLYRTTMMRQGAWHIAHAYNKSKGKYGGTGSRLDGHISFWTVGETEEGMEFLTQLLKPMQQHPPTTPEELMSKLNAAIAKLKAAYEASKNA